MAILYLLQYRSKPAGQPNQMKYILLFLAIVPNFLFAQTATSRDLSGIWQVKLDSTNVGEEEHWFKQSFTQQIRLPGSLDEAGIGKKHIAGTPLYDGQPETYRLARRVSYVGAAWYQKEIEMFGDWQNKPTILVLERCMWQTKVWLNGHYVGQANSLCVPHQHDLSAFLKPGKNTLVLKVDNSPQVNLGSWSHGYSPEVQTIWNGVIGKIQIIERSKTYLDNLQLYPSLQKQVLQVTANLKGVMRAKGKVDITVKQGDATIISYSQKVNAKAGASLLQFSVPLANKLKTWDEFSPQLYQAHIRAQFEDGSFETKIVSFGLRDLKSEDGKLMLNGKHVFLRGEHEAGTSPLTGYPEMRKSEWLKIFSAGKLYGLNHWRFHSWCPPEATFEAADELGMILQVELPLFSQKWEHTLMGKDSARDDFLKAELKRVLDAYGNHPSFALMCMGNELKGDPKIMKEMVAWGKTHDARHLYASSSNLEAIGLFAPLEGDQFQVAHAARYNGKRYERRMFPYFNVEKPNTSNDFDFTLHAPFDTVPVISHEVGQWLVYPDLKEIPKYTGVLWPRNLELVKASLQAKGMADQAQGFLKANGKLVALLYKEEMERLLRSSKMSGFQLLDLRDYPGQGSANVGLLNVFWQSKGLITPEEFKQSCNTATLLLKMPKRAWQSTEIFRADLVVPNYTASDITSLNVKWYLKDGNKLLKQGVVNATGLPQGKVTLAGQLSIDLSIIKYARKLSLHFEEANLKIANDYDLWVYPPLEASVNQVTIATEINDALYTRLQNGEDVLLVTDKFYNTEKTSFTPPFWSTIMFDYQKKTMGIYCNPQHPLFKDFPTDFHTNWQWWELLKDAKALRINQTQPTYRPILQLIDHALRNDKLAAIAETRVGKGRLLVCLLDILSDPKERIVAAQLKQSILAYMSSVNFKPQENKELIDIVFSQEAYDQSAIGKVEGVNATNTNIAKLAFDGNMESFIEINPAKGPFAGVVEFKKPRLITGCSIKSVAKTQGRASFQVFVSEDKEKWGAPIIDGVLPSTQVFESKLWDNGFTMQTGKKGKYAKIVINTQQETIELAEVTWLYGD